ncbi:MAG TPA: hypothetical protein PLE74_05225 [Candidatus Cloacimonadota bacterium]|nr:hypothetical protein [Candidatus Cloacimonadota bacterium]HPT71663.1 hypothetical protein [Candidatus Cloacimonadota bacterium]
MKKHYVLTGLIFLFLLLGTLSSFILYYAFDPTHPKRNGVVNEFIQNTDYWDEHIDRFLEKYIFTTAPESLSPNTYTRIPINDLIPFHVSHQTKVSIDWSNPFMGDVAPSDYNKRKYPLIVECESSEIKSTESLFAYLLDPSYQARRRFMIRITFKLNTSDSLYKAGERIVIEHRDTTGVFDAGDSIEYANEHHSILDANHRQVTFKYQLLLGKHNPIKVFPFYGGRFVPGGVEVRQYDFCDGYRKSPDYVPERREYDNSFECKVRMELIRLKHKRYSYL